MERKSFIWLGVFMLLAVLELLGEILGERNMVLYTKPLLMPVLVIWLLQRTFGVRRFLRHTVQAGLLFAMLGDIFLMFAEGAYGDLFFIVGLGAFLCTHLCYIGGFLSEVNLNKGYLREQTLWVLPFVLFLLGFLYWLWPNIPEGMQQPVAVYAFVITAMALSVLNMRGRISNDLFTGLLTGALLFMLSDCLIAILKFGHPFPGARVAIMVSYILGQWLIVRGTAERLRAVPERPKE